MAENPATWGKAEQVIQDALGQWDEAQCSEPDLCGCTQARAVADALREAGLLGECIGGEPALFDTKHHRDGARCKHRL